MAISGSLTTNVAPLLGPSLRASTIPLCKFTNSRTIDKPESKSAMSPGHRTISLPEPVEDVGEKAWFDTLTCIAYLEFHMRVYAAQVDAYLSARRRKFDGIRKQVRDHLL